MVRGEIEEHFFRLVLKFERGDEDLLRFYLLAQRLQLYLQFLELAQGIGAGDVAVGDLRLERADAGDQRIVLLEEVAGNEVGAAVRVLKDGKARWGLGGHGLIGFGGMGHRGKGERRDQWDPAEKDGEK